MSSIECKPGSQPVESNLAPAPKKPSGSPSVIPTVVGVGVGIGFIAIIENIHFPHWAIVAFLLALLPLFALSLFKKVHSFYIQPKSYVMEWLATTCVGGFMMLIVSEATDAIFGLGPQVDDFFELRFGIPNSYAKFAAMAATVLTVVFGSGRGWRCAERLRETRPWPRIGILLVNWLGATGLALVIPMFVICLMTMASGLPEPLSMIDWLFFLLTPLLLLLPGFIVERRIRKSELENPVPSQTIVDGKMKVETFVTLIVAAPLTWIIVPIILRIVNRLCKRRAFAPVAIDNLTPAARDYFDRMQLELARLGFELSCYSAHSAIVNNEMIHVGCWRHAGERISAVATITELCVNTIASVNHAVVMTSKCQSGEIASTHGALVPAFCKTGDEGYTISLCGEKELERYLIVHRALLAHCSQEPVWSRADETMSIEQQTAHELNDASQREMELMEKHRLCYLRRDGTAYQFTWKGAIFIGLCSVFPFLQLRQRAYKQRMQKRLAEIGVRY